MWKCHDEKRNSGRLKNEKNKNVKTGLNDEQSRQHVGSIVKNLDGTCGVTLKQTAKGRIEESNVLV